MEVLSRKRQWSFNISGLPHRRPKLTLRGIMHFLLIFIWTLRENVTYKADIYYYITTELDYALENVTLSLH